MNVQGIKYPSCLPGVDCESSLFTNKLDSTGILAYIDFYMLDDFLDWVFTSDSTLLGGLR